MSSNHEWQVVYYRLQVELDAKDRETSAKSISSCYQYVCLVLCLIYILMFGEQGEGYKSFTEPLIIEILDFTTD